jgi:hypothetical protein
MERDTGPEEHRIRAPSKLCPLGLGEQVQEPREGIADDREWAGSRAG